ncbi:MAG: hypothetical protein P9M03_04820 [Candidatus Theseobacter exili]|nr:hypothetical protein [Candidatus Theseobacter exili]
MVGKVLLLGIGFDGSDGHVRITMGDNYGVCGGSGDTHDQICNKIVQLNMEMKRRGLSLEEICTDRYKTKLRSKRFKGRK